MFSKGDRQVNRFLIPLAQREISLAEAVHETRAMLEQRLVYGAYPEIVPMGEIEWELARLLTFWESGLLDNLATRS